MASSRVCCPYCGEPLELLIDCSVAEQRYIEDCQVCCRPMQVHCEAADAGQPSVRVLREDEVA
ncbi:MAG: CPXCG motif-containing cysteine-rich protein [Xanthomonadales bacterium]|nr:CPXCG motif-containing cysteine-rich protein [Xanthomonadales bacterium]NIN60394.1 CPXCG motif-containing cysteine-rich protein [Xanthomonadales bacterium]NIN75747.1 CPXCG motif-containing cysteine-rich protein [Xanthomonadales bacterium]NIO14309.1 CPXCG motif-containing cysteine-rich protein [Xanthomonadales bacterium]NIP12787.1 CPXCG motif-containing cysteine-rich protein [Xanthomonadales bacterium]